MSVLCHNHSIETALVNVINDLRINSDNGRVSITVLLDLIVDTIDHNILKERLEKGIGLSGSALDWFLSYLKGHDFSVFLWEF